MTLLIAWICIGGFGLHWIMYPLSFIVWLGHLKWHEKGDN